VVLGVVLGRLVGVMGGVDPVAVRHVGMMAGLFVLAGFIVPRGFPVVMGGMLVMLRRARMMLVVRLAHRFLHEVGTRMSLSELPDARVTAAQRRGAQEKNVPVGGEISCM
jgi:hypothetical protein